MKTLLWPTRWGPIHIVCLDKTDGLHSVRTELEERGVSRGVALATAMDLIKRRILGCAFAKHKIQVCFIAYSNDLYIESQVVFHELGHCFAYRCGFVDSEDIANQMSGLIPFATREKFLEVMRKELKYPPAPQTLVTLTT